MGNVNSNPIEAGACTCTPATAKTEKELWDMAYCGAEGDGSFAQVRSASGKFVIDVVCTPTMDGEWLCSVFYYGHTATQDLDTGWMLADSDIEKPEQAQELVGNVLAYVSALAVLAEGMPGPAAVDGALLAAGFERQ